MANMKIPMSSPDLTELERQAVLDVLNTPILSMGTQIKKFEQTFIDLTGAKHAIGVNSGTAGLHLCVRAAGIGPGDLVITTPFSFVASSNALLFRECRSRLCGCRSSHRQHRPCDWWLKRQKTSSKAGNKLKNGCHEKEQLLTHR